MDYNKIAVGKIRQIDYDEGVGEIVTPTTTFFFTIDDLTQGDEELKKGDFVKFRAELIHNVNKAYFVTKVGQDFKLDESNVQSKVYKARGE